MDKPGSNNATNSTALENEAVTGKIPQVRFSGTKIDDSLNKSGRQTKNAVNFKGSGSLKNSFKKKVVFKSKLVRVVPIVSYKKYNADNYFDHSQYEDDEDKVSCCQEKCTLF